jgi:hypothetical protein
MKHVLIIIATGIIGIIPVFCLIFFACGCSGPSPGMEFYYDANFLRQAHDDWTSHGRPANFELGESIGPSYTFFIYTNVVRVTNGVFHCRFGARRPSYSPPGVLAITDDGQVIFICSTNGKVTISPDEYGVNP